MEVLPLRGLIDANIRVGGRQTHVPHMAEHMALGVLGAGAAEPGANAPICHGAVGDGPIGDGKAAQQHEAAAVQDLAAQLV